MLIVFRKKNPKREHGNEIVPYDEYTKGKVVWVTDTSNPTANRLEYVCTGNGAEVVPMEDFHTIREEERELARRRGGFYSRTAELTKGLVRESSKPTTDVVPLPESAMGATA